MSWKNFFEFESLTLSRMGFFGAAHGWEGAKKPFIPKICKIYLKISLKYPKMMKLGTVIPYMKKIQKISSHVTHPLNSVDIGKYK